MNSVYKLILIFANIITIFLLSNSFGFAHEFWIEPKKYKLSKGDILSASLFVGENFSGYENPYIEDNFVRFEVLSQNGSKKVNGRVGDRPALNLIPEHYGLNIIVYQSTPTYLTYNEFEKFIKFTEEKGFSQIPEQHLLDNLPEKGFKETYTRFSKSYVSVFNNEGEDNFSEMEFEWVMEDKNFNSQINNQILFSLYYQGVPHPNSLVTIFSKNNTGEVQKTYSQTNHEGNFTLNTTSNTSYLIDSVIIRKINPDSNPEGAIWESLWASATLKAE